MPTKITFKKSPLTLVGRELRIGHLAPNFQVTSSDLKEVQLSDFQDKIKIITSFLSLDTPVCDLQVKEFNKKASTLSPDIVILGISQDLPFAQKRFCESFKIQNVKIFSDYKTSSFGINYGLLIQELHLLARSVLILDKQNVLRYKQIVPEVTDAPNYPDVFKNLENILKQPKLALSEEDLLPSHCIPCEKGSPPLTLEEIKKISPSYPQWEVVDGKKIVREFVFKDFASAKYFFDLIAFLAEEQGHHPTLTLIYNKLKVTLTTHSSGGLTENDWILANLINSLYPQ